MNSPITEALENWLAQGGERIGQILIRDWALCHHDDEGHQDLQLFEGPEHARQLALHDDAGQYRPLKTAPNLRRGWKLRLNNSAELRLALDHFYPAMLGTWVALQNRELQPVPLRRTLERQTGIYAVAKEISNPDADALVARTCNSANHCLRTILWPLDRRHAITSVPPEKLNPLATHPDNIPLLCAEACNHFVAAARMALKKTQ